MSDPTIDVELGSTINAMLHSTGYRNDFHCAISEVLGSFKFIRSFKRGTETITRKKSRIKKRSTSKGFFDIRSESVTENISSQPICERDDKWGGKMKSNRTALKIIYIYLLVF